MINLTGIAQRLNKPGAKIDMLAQEAIVDSITVKKDKIIIRVTPIRNLGKDYPPDEYIWGQEEAKEYQINKWRIL